MDEYVRELMEDKGAAIWVARLRSGAVVYMDDGRPLLPRPAWLRLKERVKKERDPVVALGLRFRSHEEWPLPENAPAYFFSRAMVGDLAGPVADLMVIGAAGLTNYSLSVKKYSVPALILFEEGERPLLASEGLIVDPEGPLADLEQ